MTEPVKRQGLGILSATKRCALLGVTALCGLFSPSAKAWDVGKTHLDLSEAALLSSSAHRSMMDSTGMRLGLFSRIAIDPSALDPMQRWELEQTMLISPDIAMARPRGGEPLCPPDQKDLPKAQCLKRRPWSQDALAWLRLGVLTAAYQPHLLAEHLALPLPGQDQELPSWFRNTQRRHNQAPLTSTFATPAQLRQNGPMQRLHRRHGWSLRDLSGVMAATALAPSKSQREAATARAMVLWGIALHLVQNQSLPAFARGELEALFEPLSRRPHDRGSAFETWVRNNSDRRSIDALSSSAALPELLSGMQDWREALSRQSSSPSLPRWVSRHFISPAAFPKPRVINWDLDPQQAANELLAGQELHLRSAEREGLILKGWPAQAGYLTTASGRSLAAYQRNASGEVALIEDPAVMQENAAQLLALAMASSRHLLDRAFALPPAGVSDPSQSKKWRQGWSAPRVLMLQEDEQGQRRIVRRWNEGLPADEDLLAKQRQASQNKGQPIFVVYEGDGRKLPRLLVWRLPAATAG